MKTNVFRVVLLSALCAILLLGSVPVAFAQTPPPPGVDAASDEDAKADKWAFKGDKAVRNVLIAVTARATGQRPRQVAQALRDGQSLVEIAEAAGKTEADVLAVYDQWVERFFAKRVEKGRLTQALAASRTAWFKDVARQVIDLPGLRPMFPGLHQLHAVLIGAAVEVSGLEREAVREKLEACQTLDSLLKAEGHTGQEALEAAMQRIEAGLGKLVEAEKLTPERSQAWSQSIHTTLEKMVTTPGLHVAGKECGH